jgi:hypothetical protein
MHGSERHADTFVTNIDGNHSVIKNACTVDDPE